MRVLVTGASGNVGTAVLRALRRDPEVGAVTAIARRPPAGRDGVEWAKADVCTADLAPLMEGVDAVIHLAWVIQPARDRALTRRVNVEGSVRVFRAAARGGVSTLVHASSVGAYGPGPKDRRVGEDWPVTGIETSFYSVDKADCERALDAVEAEHPDLRVVRLRPGLIFQGSAATEIRRLFAGPFLPGALVRPRFVPVIPDVPGLAVQAVHADDVAEAYRLALHRPVRGAFNIAAEPVLDVAELARFFGARPVPVPRAVLRGLAAAAYRARVTPTEPGWLDLALDTPLLDTGRAQRELGWMPTRSSIETLEELLAGLRRGDGDATPPLDPATSGPFRVRELLSGIGARRG